MSEYIQVLKKLQRPDYSQHLFELDFAADKVSVSISKSHPNSFDTHLGTLTLGSFGLNLVQTKFDMNIRLHLR
jgi:hypothetical protein